MFINCGYMECTLTTMCMCMIILQICDNMHNNAVDTKTVKYLYCKLTQIEYCPAG